MMAVDGDLGGSTEAIGHSGHGLLPIVLIRHFWAWVP